MIVVVLLVWMNLMINKIYNSRIQCFPLVSFQTLANGDSKLKSWSHNIFNRYKQQSLHNTGLVFSWYMTPADIGANLPQKYYVHIFLLCGHVQNPKGKNLKDLFKDSFPRNTRCIFAKVCISSCFVIFNFGRGPQGKNQAVAREIISPGSSS